MEFELLGDESVGPTLSLDHEEFAYAGKFVMSSTGKTVVRDGDALVGAVAFSQDYDDPDAVRLRYVTVREDRRGEGIGPRLLRFTAEALRERYVEVLIAANNPMAYEACYRAGFVFTGEQTGIAELVLRYHPTDGDPAVYRDGYETFRGRDLPAAHEALCERYVGSDLPAVVSVPGD